MKNKKLLGIFVIIILLIIGVGGKLYMDRQAFNDEMVSVVKSDEAKKVLEQGLKNLDPKALTSDGIIKSYEIDYDSIEHNPMGGINGKIYINNDKLLYATFILDAKTDGKLNINHGISSYSSILNDKLSEGNDD